MITTRARVRAACVVETDGFIRGWFQRNLTAKQPEQEMKKHDEN